MFESTFRFLLAVALFLACGQLAAQEPETAPASAAKEAAEKKPDAPPTPAAPAAPVETPKVAAPVAPAPANDPAPPKPKAPAKKAPAKKTGPVVLREPVKEITLADAVAAVKAVHTDVKELNKKVDGLVKEVAAVKKTAEAAKKAAEDTQKKLAEKMPLAYILGQKRLRSQGKWKGYEFSYPDPEGDSNFYILHGNQWKLVLYMNAPQVRTTGWHVIIAPPSLGTWAQVELVVPKCP